jgi:long-chain acyl-CoA synthetase
MNASVDNYLYNYRHHGGQTAYVHRRGYRIERWSYRRVAEEASRFARALAARGIAKGDRVLLWGENCAEWVAAFLGCVLRGAVVVPMDRVSTADFVARVAGQVEPKLVVCSREFAALVPPLPALHLETLGETLAPHDPAAVEPPPLARTDPVEIIFTSGTTAEPKGVVLSQGNILANLEPLEAEIAKYRKYERLVHPLRFLNLLPLSHVFGQFLGIFIPQLLASTVIFSETLNPSEVIRTIQRERVSVLVAVPRLLETLKGKIERDLEAAGQLEAFHRTFRAADGEHFLLRWWRFRRAHRQFGWKFWAFISGGATLDPDVETFWSRLGFAVIQGYGLTETTSLISVNHPFQLSRGSIGKALPGREIQLAENGEILVRGESVAAGYWQGRELRPVLGEEGWFHTGDVGELDADGNLFFKGRQKEVIVTPAGMNVYPGDLEAALRRQREVRDCVVVGLPRDGNAEPCAVLLLRGPADDAEAAVRRANESLAEYQQMRRWLVWPEDDFPRTPTQKPKTGAIAEFVRARLSDRGAAAPPGSALAELIARVTGRAPERLSPEANLATDLRLSSLDRVELLSAIEDRYQIDLNETRFTSAATVGELERLLQQPAAPSFDYRYPRWPQLWPCTWARVLFYYLFAWPATLLLGYPRVRGREKLRGLRGPVLVISNHVTYLDIGFVLAALPPRFRHRLAVAMEGERLWAMRHPPREGNFFLRWVYQVTSWLIVALFNAFPLPKTSFRESFKFAGESADRGYNVLVFPEGRRTPDGKLSSFRTGTGLLAGKLGLPVVPMRIDGLYELKKAGKHWAPPGRVRVTIGEPVRLDPAAEPAEITRELERRVASLGEN